MTAVGDLLVEFKEKPGKGGEPPVLTLTERNGFVHQADRFNKRLATEDVSNYKVVRRNDIAFNPYLLWAGAVAQNTIVEKGIISPLYPTFRVREGHDPRYVARLLLTPQLISAYDSIAFGSVPRRRRSSVNNFLALPLAKVPPLPDQRRIAAILDHADALRAKRRQVLTHLDALVPATFDSMFDRGQLPHEPISAYIVEQQIGLDRRGTDQGPERSHDYLKMDAITRDGKLDLASMTRVDASPCEVAKYSLRDGDLLFNTRNSRELVGKTAVYRGRPRLYNNNVMRIRFHEGLLADYVHRYLWTSDGRRQLDARKSGTTSVFAIYAKSLSNLMVPIPPLSTQYEFAERARGIDTQRAAMQRATAADDELFASLQSRAFRGDL